MDPSLSLRSNRFRYGRFPGYLGFWDFRVLGFQGGLIQSHGHQNRKCAASTDGKTMLRQTQGKAQNLDLNPTFLLCEEDMTWPPATGTAERFPPVTAGNPFFS
jgi:hypothetical protein